MNQLRVSFQREIFAEFVTLSGLLVLGRGLGLFGLLKAFTELYATPKALVFLLCAREEEESALLKYMTGDEVQLGEEIPFKCIKNDTVSKRRMEIYLHGGVISITSRIMLIDMLKERIPAHLITGLIVLDAHRITEFGLESFIIELYRSRNKIGFIKALSERAEALTGGFSKMEKILKFLKIPTLLLYPRFHATIKADLDNVAIHVEELCVGMSPRMKMIQMGLMEALESCLREVLNSNPTLDPQEFTLEMALTPAFDKQIRRQLEPTWHRISLKSKELLGEMGTLRQLLRCLADYDAVTFCKFMETLIIADATASLTGALNSYWLMLDAARTVLQMSSDRVFRIELDGSMAKQVEALPKWHALRSILKPEERTLIMVHDEHVRRQLCYILSQGVEEWCTCKFNEFKKWREAARQQAGLSAGIATSQPAPMIRKRKSRILTSNRPMPIERKRKKEEKEEEEEGEDKTQIEHQGEEQDVKSGMGELGEANIPALPENVLIRSFFDEEDHVSMLEEITPRHVVMYDSDLAFIRSLELYRSLHPKGDLSVTVLMYKESVEEQTQLLAIRQEKEAFEQLIKIKANMAPPGTSTADDVQDDHQISSSLMTRFTGVPEEETPREHGFRLDPRTIETGDYLLTPDLCIERKSTSDLISSLNSGRLYTQVEQMVKHYSQPVLLIEFDENKPFCLLPMADTVRDNISMADISSKLCLLLLHFPQLRLIWSSSLACTAAIFLDLKHGKENPTIAITAESSEGGGEETAKDMLLALPGVTQQNVTTIMRSVRDMRDLCSRSHGQLEELVGSEAARKLYAFLHTPCCHSA